MPTLVNHKIFFLITQPYLEQVIFNLILNSIVDICHIWRHCWHRYELRCIISYALTFLPILKSKNIEEGQEQKRILFLNKLIHSLYTHTNKHDYKSLRDSYLIYVIQCQWTQYKTTFSFITHPLLKLTSLIITTFTLLKLMQLLT